MRALVLEVYSISVPNLKLISVRSKVIRGGVKKFEIVSRDPCNANLRVDLYSLRSRGLSIYVQN